MRERLQQFYQDYPYWGLVVNMILASLAGITIEYLINRDFVGSGFFATLFLGGTQAFSIYRQRKKQEKNKDH